MDLSNFEYIHFEVHTVFQQQNQLWKFLFINNNVSRSYVFECKMVLLP